MSVYARKRKDGSTAWRYDFVVKGRRFLSPARGFETRRKAEAAEAARRARIDAGKEDEPDDISLDEAAGLWWRDRGQRLKSAPIMAKRIERLLALIGPQRKLRDIKTRTVNDALQKRRATPVHGRAPANATINRDVIDTLRPILRYAARVYDLALPAIAWEELREDEPREVVREFSDAEIAAWGQALGSDVERFFLGLALTYGPRFGELFFPVEAPELDDPTRARLIIGRYKGRYGWSDKRKDGSTLAIPLDSAHAEGLAAIVAKAKAAGLETCWFAEDAKGGVTEITYWGMYARLKGAARRAGIAPGRIIHGMRHHAGSALLRATGNIIIAQRILGHRQVATTQRYAHANESDLRQGIDAVSRRVPAALLRAPKKHEEK